MIRDYLIADIGVRLISDLDIFHEWCAQYVREDIDIDMTIHMVECDTLEPCGECLIDRDNLRVYKCDDYTRAYYYNKGACYGGIAYNDEYRDASVLLVRDACLDGLGPVDIGYMLIGTLFAYRLTYFDGISLHGSAISYEGKGIIFTAPSGVGKSTQARLWHEVMCDKVTAVNDDKPALRIVNGEIRCYGTPFAGKDHINNNMCVPVKAIINVVRDSYDHIEKIDRRESLVLLLEEISRSMLSMKTNLNIMRVIDRIIESVPIYRLHCTPTHEAVRVAFDELGDIL